jgi:integrase
MAKFEVILRGRSINIRYTHLGNIPIPTGFEADKARFTEKSGAWIKGDLLLNGKINKRLSELEQLATKYLAEHDRYPTAAEFKSYMKVGSKKAATFDDVWKEFYQDRTHQGHTSISIPRIQLYNRTKRFIDDFSPGITLSGFDLKWTGRWINWLAVNKDFKQNTVGTICNVVIAFLNFANDNGYIQLDGKVTKKLRQKSEACDILFHPTAELQAMLACDLSKRPNLADTRDRYCLQCMVGLRVSDLMSYDWKEGEDYVRMKAQKTGEEIVVPLRSEAKALIKRLLSRPGGMRKINDQDYNEEIKDVGRLAGVTEEIYFVHGKRQFKAGHSYPKYKVMSSHMARATFICQMIELGVHYKMIMTMTGIKDVKTLDHYATVLDMVLKAIFTDIEKRQNLSMMRIA